MAIRAPGRTVARLQHLEEAGHFIGDAAMLVRPEHLLEGRRPAARRDGRRQETFLGAPVPRQRILQRRSNGVRPSSTA